MAKNFYTVPIPLQVFEKLKDICNTQKTQASELYKIISIDPVLTALTLRLFNMFHPKESKKFSGIAKIIIMLNRNTVKNHLIDVVCSDPGANSKKAIDCWLRSAAGAAAAKFLCEIRGIKSENAGEYQAAALLRDFANLPAEFAFEFPDSIKEVNLNYKSCNNYSGEYKDIVYNTSLVNYIVDKYVFKTKKKIELDKNIFEYLKMEETVLEKMEPELIKEITSYINFVGAKVRL